MVAVALSSDPHARIDVEYPALFAELTRLCRAVGAGDDAQTRR